MMIVAPRRQILAAVAAIALGAALITLIGVLWGPAGERVMTVFFVSLIGVVGIGVYSGNSGILSFGHVAFMGVGAYASALMTVPAMMMKKTTLPNLPAWLAGVELGLPEAILVAMLVAVLVALVAGLAIGRLDGSSAVIATLGLLIIVHGVLIGWRDVTRGAQSFFGVPRATDVYTAAICCALALIAARLYRDSVSGLRLRAARENAIAAQAVGVNIKRERMIAWLLSAALMALSGALLAHFLGAFSPKKFYFHDTFLLLSMLIVGGMATVSGAVAGAVIITIVTEILRRMEGGLDLGGVEIPSFFGATQIGIGLIILLAMFRKSEGVFGFKEWEERLGVASRTEAPDAPDARTPLAPAEDERRTLTGESLTMRFGGLVAVNEVSIRLEPGEILGLIGPNGSGKTTLLNMLSGVLTPTAGSAHLGERDLLGARPDRIAEFGVARTFQNIRLFGALSVRQNVLTAALSTHGGENATERAEAAMTRLGVGHVAGLDAHTLSYGDQRRVEIARALACRPALLFLDEPAAGMNREETDALMAVLRGLARDDGIGVLLVDHDLQLINALCDRIVVLNEGRLIAEGGPAEVRNNPAVIEAYIGRQKLTEHPAPSEMET